MFDITQCIYIYHRRLNREYQLSLGLPAADMKRNDFSPQSIMENIVFSNITAGDLPNWTETTIANLGDLLQLVYMWVRMSIFDKIFLKENGRTMSLKHLERVKWSMRPPDGYLLIRPPVICIS